MVSPTLTCADIDMIDRYGKTVNWCLDVDVWLSGAKKQEGKERRLTIVEF